MKFINPPTTAFIQQNNKTSYFESIYVNSIKQDWVPIKLISKNIAFSVIASEDQRFPQHFGLDYVELEKVVEDRITKGKVRGGSTITQQVAKNLFLYPQKLTIRKLFEVYYATLLEIIWTKSRILEVYLNIAQFGENIYGVEAASKYYFRKPAKNLSKNEAAQIASILPNPVRLNLNNKSNYLNRRISRIERMTYKINQSEIIKLLNE